MFLQECRHRRHEIAVLVADVGGEMEGVPAVFDSDESVRNTIFLQPLDQVLRL